MPFYIWLKWHWIEKFKNIFILDIALVQDWQVSEAPGVGKCESQLMQGAQRFSNRLV
jgi:hypothetical protein